MVVENSETELPFKAVAPKSSTSIQLLKKVNGDGRNHLK